MSLFDIGVDGAEENGIPKVPPNHQKHHHDSGNQIVAYVISVADSGHRHYDEPKAVAEGGQALLRVAQHGGFSFEEQNEVSEVEDGKYKGIEHEVDRMVGNEGLQRNLGSEGLVVEYQVDSLQSGRVVLGGVVHLEDLVGHLDDDQSNHNVVDWLLELATHVEAVEVDGYLVQEVVWMETEEEVFEEELEDQDLWVLVFEEITLGDLEPNSELILEETQDYIHGRDRHADPLVDQRLEVFLRVRLVVFSLLD